MNQLSKIRRYEDAITVIERVLRPGVYALDIIGKMATISSILKMHFPEWIFVGFYRVVKKGLLEIGPYQGPVLACGTIKFGRGVCGVCAQNQKTIIVNDVTQFPDYIACDEETQSEIVVPIMKNEKLIGVLDVDSDTISTFNDNDQKFLEEIVTFI